MKVNLEVVPEFALAFLEELREKGKKESTITRYYRDLLTFFNWLLEERKEITYEAWESLDLGEYEKFHDDKEGKYSSSMGTTISSLLKFHGLEIDGIQSILKSTGTRPLQKKDFVTEQEVQKLLKTMSSRKDLTENQLKAFPFLSNRNRAIVHLFYQYGLRITEITRINMEDINFAQHELAVKDGDGSKRIIKLDHEHQHIIRRYYKEDIPKPVRPYEYSKHPLFVAFDFERQTFRWNYESNAPKRLGVKAIQKMMKQEVERAGLRKGVSGLSMRNTCILQKMNEGKETEELQQYFSLKNPLSLWRYEKYLEVKKQSEIKNSRSKEL